MYSGLCVFFDLSLCARKPTIWVPTRSVTLSEEGWKLEISDLRKRGIVLSV